MLNVKKYRTEVIFLTTLILISGVVVSADISNNEQTLQNGEARITIATGEYEIIGTEKGHEVFVEDFGHLLVPGKPMLPAKNFLIALPPGARAQSVEVRGIGAKELPGTYRMKPTPPILPLASPDQFPEWVEKMRDEWQTNNQTVYSKDQAYPKERGKLTGSGTLRKYSYASVSFYPFSYHPRSGRLVHYDAAEIILHYSLPSPGSSEAQRVEYLKRDTLADEKASRLFVNYQEIKGLYQPSRLRSKVLQQTYDYVIVTTNALSEAIISSNFVSWKTSLGYNVKLVLITDSEITSQPGIDLAEQIRNFLRSYYIPWGIEYVLLVGDYVTIPMRYCYPNPYVHYNPGGEVPTDYYYADLSNLDAVSWDSDGDGFHGEYGQDNPDFLAEVYVGRIPTNDSARTTYTLNKLVVFEQDTGTWKNQALHAGAVLAFANQDYSGLPLVDGCRSLDLIETDIMSGWTVSHYSEQAGLAPSYCNWPALSQTAFTEDWLNGQYGVVNWAGHGSSSGASRMVWSWDDGDSVPETHDPSEITHYAFISTYSNLNDDYPSIVFAISCNVGYPEPNGWGNLGIDLLTKPGFGSSAGVISATRGAAAAVYWDSIPGGAESMCYEFNRYMINGPSGPEKVSNALYNSKFYCNQNYGWDHYYEYQNMFDFNLYGDPSLVREGAEPTAQCGDANRDEQITVSDVIYIINYLFKGGPSPDPILIGDADCDCQVSVSDIIHLIIYLFKGGPPPGCQET